VCLAPAIECGRLAPDGGRACGDPARVRGARQVPLAQRFICCPRRVQLPAEHRPADLLVRLSERSPGGDQGFRGVGCQEARIARGGAQAVAIESQVPNQELGGAKRVPCAVNGPKQRSLVFLQVAVIGQGQALEDGRQGDQAADGAACTSAQQLGDVGILLLGHEAGSGSDLVGQVDEPEFGAGPQHDVLTEPAEVEAGDHAGVYEVERKVSIRHRIDAVGRQALETKLFRDNLASQRQRRAGQRTRPERHLVGGLVGVAKALGIAKQRLGVCKEVVADGHRLRALEVCVAGHQPTGVIGCLRGQSIHDGGGGVDLLAGGGAAVEAEVERDLVVARASGVQRCARRRDLGQPSFYRRVDVLV